MNRIDDGSPEPAVIIGAGPAGRSAMAILPDARRIARPEATAWHAEPGRIWIETASGVSAIAFVRLLLCADEPLLLMALGCAFADGHPVVDATGATSVAGIFAAGRILGAATPEAAAEQARIAASAIAGSPAPGRIVPRFPAAARTPARRLDPLDIACLLETPPGPDRNRAALAQAGARGGRVADLITPARPVGFAALAAIAPATLDPREAQPDGGALPRGLSR